MQTTEQGFLASFFKRARTRWTELPRRYNLFQCPQPDEVESASIWHLTPNFHGAFGHGLVRQVTSDLDTRVNEIMHADAVMHG